MAHWNWMYLGRPRWDSGVTPPELTRVVVGQPLPPGRALDLGCGTGTNVLYLALHGFEVVGIDIAWLAVLRARWRLLRARPPSPAHLVVGDAARLPAAVRVRAPYDFVLDVGCFHSLDAAARADYVAGLRAVTRPGAIYLLYVFRPPSGPAQYGAPGAAAAEVEQRFAGGFRVVSVEEGAFAERASAWYRFERV